VPVIPENRKHTIGRFHFRPAWAKIISKITRAKRTGGMVQVVENLPTKCKALSPYPSTDQKQTNKKIKKQAGLEFSFTFSFSSTSLYFEQVLKECASLIQFLLLQ
jgi:hypothetical protein